MGQTEGRVPDDPVRQALAALATPNRSAVLVVGPPGSGKSRVLSEVQAQPDAGRPPRLVALDDADQLDPGELASQFPATGGWSMTRLEAQLAELAAGCRIVGLEVTALEDPGIAPAIARAIQPLLEG